MNKQHTQEQANKNNKERTNRINYNIRNEYSRVIEAGKTPIIMRTSEAITYAKNLGLDLVEIGYDKVNQCSNCKIYDYSKFIYEQKKRVKEAKKHARANKMEIKVVQFSLTTDSADKLRMINHAKEFLANGNKVKITLRFRNRREIANAELAKSTMRSILLEFDDIAILDSNPTLNGKEFSCIIRKK